MIYEVELWAFCNGAVRSVDCIAVDTEDWFSEHRLEDIFYYGQNDNQPSVSMPSVSVGDVARIGEDRWL